MLTISDVQVDFINPLKIDIYLDYI